MIKRLFPALLLAAFAGAAFSKLPAPVLDDAAKAKAAEAAARTAWQGKLDAWQLCKAQDKVAAKFGNKSTVAKPVSTAAALPASAAAASAAASAPTPASAAAPSPCNDPGPFAYNPPSQTPLETAGAHSPAGTATKPPNVNATASQLNPASAAKK